MDSPIIIGGVERSGTSLLRAILGSHPELAIFQWDLPLWRCFYQDFGNRDLSHDDCQDLLPRIMTHRKAIQAETVPDREDVLQLLRQKGKPLRCEDVFGAYLRAYAEQRRRKRWGLKTPTNEFYAESIFRAFPKASLLHVIRDPRDVVVSMMKTKFVRRVELSMNPRYFATNGVLAWWKMSAEVALENQRRFPNRYHVVKYEDITADTTETVASLCKVCGLEYSSDMLAMNGHPGWSGSNSQIDSDTQEGNCVKHFGKRYPTYLEPHQIAFIEDVIGEYMEKYGYKHENRYMNSWKKGVLKINYRISPAVSGLRAAYQEVRDEMRRKSTEEIFDY